MRLTLTILAGSLAILLVVVLIVMSSGPTPVQVEGKRLAPSSRADAVRIAIIPERDILSQPKRYQALADYLGDKLGRPVELVLLNTYQSVLEEFAARQVDGAFLGSLIAVLTMDRLDGRVIVKTELPGGVSVYRGVIFVRGDSDARSVEDLAGKSIGMLRTTTGGNLFPIDELIRTGVLNGPKPPKLVWVGTHDEVIRSVIDGTAAAGGVKNLVLDEYERAHPGVKFKRLAASGEVPNNALVLRSDVAGDLGPSLRKILLDMNQDAAGRQALATFGAARFLPCEAEQYHVIYDIVERIGGAWEKVGVAGPAPRRPATRKSEVRGQKSEVRDQRSEASTRP